MIIEDVTSKDTYCFSLYFDKDWSKEYFVVRKDTGKSKILREKYVKPLYPQIIDEDEYFLGKLPANKLWHLDDKPVAQFVENLISYSIVRDVYREDAKKAAGLI